MQGKIKSQNLLTIPEPDDAECRQIAAERVTYTLRSAIDGETPRVPPPCRRAFG